jgi:predicted ATP-binding protein involved in virulence
MRLDRLHLQNFRCYEDATFEFQPGFNLVVGVNGSGKTSLLQAAITSLSPFINVLSDQYIWGGIDKDEIIRFVVDNYEGRVRFERRLPLVIEATGQAFSETNWRIAKAGKEIKFTPADPFAEAASIRTEINSAQLVNLPIVAFYKASRRWQTSGVTAEFAATQQASRFAGYGNWADAAVDLKAFEVWYIGTTLERLETLSKQGVFPERFDDELEWVNSALRLALSDSADFRYDLKLRMLMVDLGDDHSIPFNELSDGQRSMVALIADIARRMCLLNPHMGKHVLTSTDGIVVIDELDIHLHPAWQRTIVSTLKKAFPKVQFIAASHSPQIIGGLEQHEVMILDNGRLSHPRVTYGLDSSSVLEEVMGASQREPEVQRLLSELFSILEDGDLSLATAKLNELKAKAPDLPEFHRAEALLKRKGVLGK